MLTDEELKPTRVLYVALVTDLQAAGLTSTANTPAKKKLLRYMLAQVGKDSVEEMTHEDFATFFRMTDEKIRVQGAQAVIAEIEAAQPLAESAPSQTAQSATQSTRADGTGFALRCVDELLAELTKDSFSTARAGQILSQLRAQTPRGRWTDMVRVVSDRVLKADISWVREWLKTYGRRDHPARSMDRLLTKMEFIARRPNAKGAGHYPVMPKLVPAKTAMPQVQVIRPVSEQARQQAFEQCERARMRAAIAAFNAEFQP